MEIDTLLSAFRDFEKKGKKEPCPVLDQFLCHIAKTGETMIQWSQFKNYFLFKLEKVMDDFKASCPEQRGPANPNVEHVPFEEMKERILKIVDGYNGIPFTIQRLCELLTEPRRNYTGTDKFLRGVEKNVMVVSCVCPTSEKNGSSCVNRMNGVMLPGHSTAFSDRNVNGPGTPRPLNRPKLSVSSSAATNGLPDSTENKEPAAEQPDKTVSDLLGSAGEADGSSRSPLKSKHPGGEDAAETDRHDVKRLKFEEDDEEEEEEEDDEEENEEDVDGGERSVQAESTSERPESSSDVCPAEGKSSQPDTAAPLEDHEPSSTQTDPLDDSAKSLVEDSPDHSHSHENGVESDTSEQEAPRREERPAESQGAEEKSDPVSSSSSEEGGSSTEAISACSSSSASSPAEGSAENSDSSETAEEPMEQD